MTSSRVDIAFVITGLSMGGAEVQVTELALRHARLGRKVLVISMVAAEGVLATRLERANVAVHSLDMPKGRPTLSGLLRAARILRASRPVVVHGHMFHANLLVRVLRPVLPRCVVVCTAHNSNEGGWPRMLAYRATNWLGDAMTNVSEVAARELERRGAARRGYMQVVWNAIDTDRFRSDLVARKDARRELGLAEADFMFMAVGRLVPQKDYETLLRAFAEVLVTRPGDRLAIVGAGELKPALQQLCAVLGVGTAVSWLGEREDVDRLMNGADGFVLSSIFEGFGLVVAEAMAIGLPVVATRSCGPEEVLGGEGRLVPPRDVQGFARAMTSMAADPPAARAAELARARQRVVERFSFECIMKEWSSLYARLGANLSPASQA